LIKLIPVFFSIFLFGFGGNYFTPKTFTGFFDTSGTTNIQNGSGNWDFSTSNFSYDTTNYTQTKFVSGSTAAFGRAGSLNPAGTVSVSGTQIIGGLLFDTVPGNYTITAGNLTCAYPSCTITNNGDGTIASTIIGNAGWTKTGASTLNLTAANTYTGGTSVTGGTLNIGGGGSTGSIPLTPLTVNLGSLLKFQYNNAFTPTPLTVAGNLEYTTTNILTLPAGTYDANQILMNGSYVNINGNLVISAGAGGATINGNHATLAGITSSTNRSITTNGNVTFFGTTGGGNFIDGISLAGNYVATNGILTFDGNAGASGAYGVESGVSGGWAGSISINGNVTFKGSGGTARNSDLNVGPITGQGNLTLIGRSKGLNTLSTFNGVGGPLNVTLQTTAGGINQILGSGTDNTNNGNYTINSAGDILFGTRTINAGTGDISITSGTNTTINGNTTLNGNNLSFGNNNDVIINDGFTLNVGAGGTIPGIVSGLGAFTKSGTGVLTLSNTNTYSGVTSITGGTLVFQKRYPSSSIVLSGTGILELATPNPGLTDYPGGTISGTGRINKTGPGQARWGFVTLNMSLNPGSLLDIQEGSLDAGSGADDIWENNRSSLNVATGASLAEITYGPSVFDALTGGGSIGTNSAPGPGPHTITVGINNHAAGVYNAAGTATFSGTLTGDGSLIKVGTGNQILIGNSPFTGTTTISEGTLTLGDGIVTGNIIPQSNKIVDNAALIYNTLSNITHSGVISGTGIFTKEGTGTLTLSGANTYSGNTTISNGNLTISSNTAYASPNYSIANGATLEYAIAVGGDHCEGSITYSGAGKLVKSGAGQVRWCGSSTFNLAAGSLIDVQGGSFDAGSGANDNYSGNRSSLNVATGATLAEITYDPAVFDAVTGGGSIQMHGTSSFTLGINNHAAGVYNTAGTATFSGILSQTGKLIKVGTGTQILSGNNTFSGGIELQGGTIRAGHINGFGTGAVNCLTPCTSATCRVERNGQAANTVNSGGLCTVVP
jgi:fibronectin-binding autotransporter adhesin